MGNCGSKRTRGENWKWHRGKFWNSTLNRLACISGTNMSKWKCFHGCPEWAEIVDHCFIASRRKHILDNINCFRQSCPAPWIFIFDGYRKFQLMKKLLFLSKNFLLKDYLQKYFTMLHGPCSLVNFLLSQIIFFTFFFSFFKTFFLFFLHFFYIKYFTMYVCQIWLLLQQITVYVLFVIPENIKIRTKNHVTLFLLSRSRGHVISCAVFQE